MVLFATNSSLQPCTITVYNIFINYLKALSTVQTILVLLIFLRTVTIDFALVSHFFSVLLDICKNFLLLVK